MNKDDFERLFDERVAGPLVELGATARGRSLLWTRGDCTLLWTRAAGRRTQPGAIVHVVGCRHACNRDTQTEKLPKRPPSDITHYPWRFVPGGLASTSPSDWGFSTERVFRTPYDTLRWADRSKHDVGEDLDRLRTQVAERYFPWFCALSHTDAQGQLAGHPDFWAARLWAEDYTQEQR